MAKKFFTNESLAALIDEIKAFIENALSSKSDSSHAHDDKYYTEAEVDEMMSSVAFINITGNGTIPDETLPNGEEVTF